MRKITTEPISQHLVDWSKAMIPQVGKLGTLYSEWVNKPVDRPLRLFGPWYLECLTKTPWWIVPMVWIPAITFIVKHEYLTNELLAEHNVRMADFLNIFIQKHFKIDEMSDCFVAYFVF